MAYRRESKGSSKFEETCVFFWLLSSRHLSEDAVVFQHATTAASTPHHDCAHAIPAVHATVLGVVHYSINIALVHDLSGIFFTRVGRERDVIVDSDAGREKGAHGRCCSYTEMALCPVTLRVGKI